MFTVADYRRLLADFAAASKRRAAAERQLAAHFGGDDAEGGLLAAKLAERQAERETRQAELAAERDAVLAALAERRQAAIDEAAEVERAAIAKAVSDYERESEALERDHSEKTWVVGSLLDDQADDSPQRRLDRLVAAYDATEQTQLAAEEAVSTRLSAEAGAYGVNDVSGAADPSIVEPLAKAKPAALEEAHRETCERAEEQLARLRRMRVARLLRGVRVVVPVAAVAMATAAVVYHFVSPAEVGVVRDDWPAAVGVGGLVVTLLGSSIWGLILTSRRNRAIAAVAESLATAEWIRTQWRKRIDPRRDREVAKLQEEIDDLLARRESKEEQMAGRRGEREAALIETRDRAIREAEASRAAAIERANADHDEQTASVEDEHTRRTDEAMRAIRERIIEATEAVNDYQEQRSTEISELESRMTRGWNKAVSDLSGVVTDARLKAANASWERLAEPDWQPPRSLPSGLRIGTFDCPLDAVPEAISERPSLALPSETVELPAMLPFPSSPSAIFRGTGAEAREQGTRALQVALLRAFTQIPPGKVRCTLLDPVGLGEAFAAFMHLADADERLVSGRVWTQTQQIEAQLADLTEHMENVLQTYLRGDFETIEQYNEKAGEVAEPYRLLVVAGFPHRFSEVAWRRLVSIATSGPRCGVYLLMTQDTAAELPHAANLDDLLDTAEVFEWDGRCYRPSPRGSSAEAVRNDDLLEDDAPKSSAASPQPPSDPATALRLRVDPIPPPSTFTAIIRNVADASLDAGRVEVSFGRVAPTELWTESTRDGLDIPLGRAGATKLQHARFGRGTAQHMLVAGKTGSGKSTFLHALVTSAAMRYSPDEIRFYLIDFKKGVEFKAYAGGVSSREGGNDPLPHADVIAIESEREFGISALRRLDELLDERGERFREQGVQDIAGYRKALPDAVMPRVLLLIDEFQEFFVEDDKLSQEATLLLDRLVRQGRAFGVHCVLGSQTLGGAYGLPRTTLGQIGIRVALQCSEADSHLIMAEDNTAARLLGRPGEAIYNDQGGLAAGNQPFQVAWLPDAERADRLAGLAAEASQRGLDVTSPVIFEGDKPAKLAANARVRSLLDGQTPDTPGRLRIDLGDAVEIKPPTGVDLLRQGGRNLLLCGPAADLARGTLAAAAVQRALLPDAASTVLVLRDPVTSEGVWEPIAEWFPKAIRLFAPFEAADAVAELHADLQSRTGPESQTAPAKLLLIDGVAQFRSLARPEDDFGFSRSPKLSNPLAAFGDGEAAAPTPEPVDPGQQFADLLADGPERGLHTLAFADGFTAADRILGRKGLKEFALRMLTQLNGNDSSQLIESPAASRLEGTRALLYHLDTGKIEKFRPYGTPDLAALAGPENSTDADGVDSVQVEGDNDDDDGPVDEATDLDGFLVV